MSKHATLSASGAPRWMKCAGSIQLSRGLPNVGSAAAGKGTAAHALGEQILEYHLNTGELDRGLRARYKQGTTIQYDDHGATKMVNVMQEMLDHVMVYVNHMIELKKTTNGKLLLEQHLSLERLVRDGMFGTADAIIVPPKQTVLKFQLDLIVTDFKYGFTPVRLVDDDGEPNAQLLYYAAAALDKFGWHHPWVIIEVVQPRCTEVEPIQSLRVKSAEVKHWATTKLYDAAHATDAKDAPLVTGSHCRWCPAISICPEVAREAGKLAMADFAEEPLGKSIPPVPTSPEQLSKILRWAPVLDAWLRACELAAQQEMEAGRQVQGFKLVRKKSNREWPDLPDVKIEQLLKDNGLKVKKMTIECYSVPKLLSPAQMEKLPGGKDAVAAVAIKPDAGLTVAAESDRCKAVALSPGADFEEEDLI